MSVSRLQSSPPVRAWDRPSSPTNSHNSLDLVALGLDDRSDDGSPPNIPPRHVDPIRSEDIDGPSDFTINMAAWMRGGTMGKGTARSARSGLRSLKEQEARGSSVERKQGEHLEVPQSPEEAEEEHTTSHHTPDHSPPKSSPWHERPSFRDEPEAEPEQEREHDSSAWDPYAPSGTPEPPAHKHFLQPSAEGYQSELPPPAYLPSASADKHSLRITTNHPSRSPRPSDPGSPGRPSSDTLSPAHSPDRSPDRSVIMRRSHPTAAQTAISSLFPGSAAAAAPVAHDLESEIETQIQQLQTRCRQLESLNSALKQALDEEQRVRRLEKGAREREVVELGRKERGLVTEKIEAERKAEGLEQEVRKQKARALQLQTELERQREEAEDAERRHEEEVGRLREEMASRATLAEDQAMQRLTRELQDAQSGREAAEENARLGREELEEFRDSEAAEMEQLRREVALARSRVGELEQSLNHAAMEKESLRHAKKEFESATAVARKEGGDQTLRLNDELQQAMQSSQAREAQIKDLQQQLRDEQTSHDDEIEKLESAHETALGAATDAATVAQREVEAKQSALNEAILEWDAAQDSLTGLQASHSTTDTELGALRSDLETTKTELRTCRADLAAAAMEREIQRDQLADSVAVNAALDARVSETMRTRELHWRAKLADSERERRAMGKALLHQWGREEVGVDEPQGYTYKYAVRT
ncbi:hypothetical protein LTR53_001655 [Teratosphaeriaceae sp. CCFEE 6253]|nr:hypothetical protein LTR53_001655 [Teratosphaeriaceae sp. CCFEE 6253]